LTRQSIFFAKAITNTAIATMDGYAGQARVWQCLPLAQTIWSTRVPCPGGSGAGTVARVACVSPASGVWGALTTGGFTAGGATGATGVGVEMLEILIENIPQASSGTL